MSAEMSPTERVLAELRDAGIVSGRDAETIRAAAAAQRAAEDDDVGRLGRAAAAWAAEVDRRADIIAALTDAIGHVTDAIRAAHGGQRAPLALSLEGAAVALIRAADLAGGGRG